MDMGSRTRRRMRRAIATLAAGILGLVTAISSGLAMTPRVRLVEVLTVVASAVGAGAALALAVGQLRHARADRRSGSNVVSGASENKAGDSARSERARGGGKNPPFRTR